MPISGPKSLPVNGLGAGRSAGPTLVRKPLCGPVMHRNVEVLIGRLATDPGLRRRFAAQPHQALREQALELTEVELEALAATDPEALRDFTATLDPRLRKTTTQPEPTTDSKKETRR